MSKSKSAWRLRPTLLVPFVVFALAACSSSNPSGGLRQSCYPNQTCNAGLTCVSQVCVDLNDGGAVSQSGNGGSNAGAGGAGTSGAAGANGGSAGHSPDAGAAGAGGSAGTGGGGGQALGPGGQIVIQQCVGGALCAPAEYTIEALFGSTSCPLQTQGCTQVACVPLVSAGTLTISGGSIPRPLTASPSNGIYDTWASGTIVATEQTISVSASGSTVPAFGQSVVAPGAIALTSPLVASNGSYTISTKADLAVSWTGRTAGDLVQVTGSSAQNPGIDQFTCVWDAAAGQGVVPAAMLTSLHNMSGNLYFGQMGSPVRFSAGAYAISLTTFIRRCPSRLPVTGAAPGGSTGSSPG